MGIFRIFAWILVALGFSLLGADVISSLETNDMVIRTTAEVSSLFGVQLSNLESGALAKPINFFLNAPLWSLIGGLGIILTLIFRPLD